MRGQRNEITWMLGTLLFFSWGVSFLHGQKSSSATPSLEKNVDLRDIKVENTLRYLYPLLVTQSVDLIIDLLQPLPFADALRRTELIVDAQNSSLNREDKAQLIGAMAHHFAANKKEQQVFFSLLLKHPSLYLKQQDQEPLGYIISRFGYADLLLPLAAWYSALKTAQPTHALGTIINDALEYAARYDDLVVLEAIKRNGIRISAQQATSLLFLLSNSKNTTGKSLSLLVALGADINAVDSRKFTPLMYAVDNKNVELLKTMLAAGAQPNIIADPAVGNALQIARSHAYIDIENMLRAAGAKD